MLLIIFIFFILIVLKNRTKKINKLNSYELKTTKNWLNKAK
ncbi:MAG: hypothetical protein MRERV_9c063 [Mycoplasmataceae bacterium RV_VA103A]|nr:MAG: hypothetical protein MRERV_9c063 [Mycoplasmataceae bacterium RV_VA103A]